MKKNVRSSLIFVGKIIAVLSFNATALAVVGSNFVKGLGGNAATCRIISRDFQGDILQVCSGSLVARNKVLTAAHCVTDNMDTVVADCGFDGIDRYNLSWEHTKKGSVVYTSGVLFLESAEGEYKYVDRDHDQAVLTLSRKLKIKPLSFRSMYVITPEDRCHLEGYGRTNDATMGILYSGALNSIGPRVGLDELADITRVVIRKAPGQVSAYKDLYKMPETSFVTEVMSSVVGRRGDSGGPIICQRGNEYNVVSVQTQILIQAPRDPYNKFNDPRFEVALHTSFSRLIQPNTASHILDR